MEKAIAPTAASNAERITPDIGRVDRTAASFGPVRAVAARNAMKQATRTMGETLIGMPGTAVEMLLNQVIPMSCTGDFHRSRNGRPAGSSSTSVRKTKAVKTRSSGHRMHSTT